MVCPVSVSSFAKILTIFDLFSIERSAINVDIICQELNVSKPMGYRYLKELVDAGLLKKASHNVGDYVLGSKIAFLDFISRTTEPLVQISIPLMQDIVARTDMVCLLTALDGSYCIDLHHEPFAVEQGAVYGRGHPRALSAGSSAKIILAHLPKKLQLDYYQLLATELTDVDYAYSEQDFLQKMREIKKQGYYVSKGELKPSFSSVSVPLRFSSKEAPWALTVATTSNRFEYIYLEKTVELLKQAAAQIEQHSML